MIIYLAALASHKRHHKFITTKFPEFGALATFAEPRELPGLIRAGFKTIVLDSGAYSVMNSERTIDVDELITFAKKYADYITTTIALDVHGNPDAGRENWEHMEKQGVTSLPTYHLGEDHSYLRYYVDNSPYVGIGGMAGKKTSWKHNHRFLERLCSDYPETHFHCFGVGTPTVLSNLPMYSADATTWMNGGKYGELVSRHGRFALNEKGRGEERRNADIWIWLQEEYGYTKEQVLEDGFNWTLIDRVNIAELYYLLVQNHNPKFSRTRSLYSGKFRFGGKGQ